MGSLKEIFVEKGYSEIVRSLSEFLDKTYLETETILKQRKVIWKNIPFPKIRSEENVLKYYKENGNELLRLLREDIYDINLNKDINIISVLNREESGKDVLDYGSGPGLLASRLSLNGFNVTCVDPCKKTNEYLRFKSKRDINLKVIDFDDFKWDNQYDVVVCMEVIEHVNYPGKLLRKLMDAVKDEGHLVLEYPDKWFEPENNPEHIAPQEFREKITKILDKSGFKRVSFIPAVFKKTKEDPKKINFIRLIVQDESVYCTTSFKVEDKDKLINALEIAKKNTIEKFGGK